MSTLAYPKNGGAFLLQRITDLHASIADLIDELVKRDQTVAEQAAQIAKLTPPPDAPAGSSNMNISGSAAHSDLVASAWQLLSECASRNSPVRAGQEGWTLTIERAPMVRTRDAPDRNPA